MTREPAHDHRDDIMIDLAGWPLESEALFHDDSEWDGVRLVEPRLTLAAVWVEDDWMPRNALVSALDIMTRWNGERLVSAAESGATERWAETAEADRADAHADAEYDCRSETAA